MIRISTKPEDVNIVLVHRFLSQESYWAKGVAFDTVRKSLAHSLCFGGFVGAEQVAFGRAVSDLTTFAYLLDFFVLPEYRGRGYGKALVDAAISRLRAEGVRVVMLRTTDAHGLYKKFGFERIDSSSNVMRCALVPDKFQ